MKIHRVICGVFFSVAMVTHVACMDNPISYDIKARKGDEDKKKEQLNSPLGTAQLVDALPIEVRRLIQSHIECNEIKNHFVAKIVTKNSSLPYKKLTDKKFSSSSLQFYHDRWPHVVPSAFVGGTFSFKGGACMNICIDGLSWVPYHRVIIDEQHAYQITPSEALVDGATQVIDYKKFFLWVIDRSNKGLNRALLEYKFVPEGFVFSADARRLVVYCKDAILLSAITLREDNAMFVDRITLDHPGIIKSVCFDPRSTVLLSWACDGLHSDLKIWDTSGTPLATLDFAGEAIYQVLFNHDGSRLLIRTKVSSATAFLGRVMVYDMTNLSRIKRLVDKMNMSGKQHDAVYSSLGDMWMIPTHHRSMVFIRNVLDHCESREYKDASDRGWNGGIISAICSPDNKFFIALIPRLIASGFVTRIWNALTGDYITTVDCPNNVEGVGVTADSHELIYLTNGNYMNRSTGQFWNEQHYYTRPLLRNKDVKILDDLMKNASITELIVLRRFWLAYQHGEMVELYKKEPAYKILCALSEKDHMMRKFVKKYMQYKVINDKSAKKRVIDALKTLI
jgi:hypothetical protein